MAEATALPAPSISALLRGDQQCLRGWMERSDARQLAICIGAIVAGTGAYGAAMGWWRAPLQALFVAVKFPLIILLTTIGNGLLNALLAPLLGLNISLRHSLLAVLMSFMIAAAILGSFTPLAAYVVWNAPPMSNDLRRSGTAYSSIQLMHVVVISFAGVVGNARLLQLLGSLGGAVVARRVFAAWLIGNLFLGSQLCWICRPFIGSPGLQVQFLRPDPLKGNFYETVFSSTARVLDLD